MYARGSVGYWSVSNTSAGQSEVGECGGGGINYSPGDNGIMSVNLLDVQECKTPYGVNPCLVFCI